MVLEKFNNILSKLWNNDIINKGNEFTKYYSI